MSLQDQLGLVMTLVSVVGYVGFIRCFLRAPEHRLIEQRRRMPVGRRTKVTR